MRYRVATDIAVHLTKAEEDTFKGKGEKQKAGRLPNFISCIKRISN
jgi:hypothetical protein